MECFLKFCLADLGLHLNRNFLELKLSNFFSSSKHLPELERHISFAVLPRQTKGRATRAWPRSAVTMCARNHDLQHGFQGIFSKKKGEDISLQVMLVVACLLTGHADFCSGCTCTLVHQHCNWSGTSGSTIILCSSTPAILLLLLAVGANFFFYEDVGA